MHYLRRNGMSLSLEDRITLALGLNLATPEYRKLGEPPHHPALRTGLLL